MATIDRRGATVSATDAPSSSTPNPDIAIKTACRVATTGANINLLTFGLGVLDGVQLAAGDRALIKDQTDPTQNGIYNVSSGVWAQSSDFQNNSQVANGTQVLVTDGAGNARTRWVLVASNPVLLGTSAISFQPLQEPVVLITDLPGVDAGGTTDSAAAIRAYIDAQPAGANIVLVGTTSSHVLMDSARNNAAIDMVGANATKTLTILGTGWTLSTNGDFTKPQGTIFKLGPNFPSTADFYRHQPNGTLLRGGVRFKDFMVVPSGGVNSTPRGRHGFFFDGSASLQAYIERPEIHNIYVDNMATGYSIYSKALDGSQGMLAGAQITHNMMMQIRAENFGDRNTISDNTLGVHATDDARNFGIYYYCVSGATNPRVVDNYIFSFQGFIEDDGSIAAVIEGNEAEINLGTNTVGWLVRLTGSKSKVSGAKVKKNRLSQNIALATTTPIVVANASSAEVDGNWVATPTDYAQVVVQASARNTKIGASNVSWVGGVEVDNMDVSYAGSVNTVIETTTHKVMAVSNAPSPLPASSYMGFWFDLSDGRLHDVNSTGGFATTVKPTTAPTNQYSRGLATTGDLAYAQVGVSQLGGAGSGVLVAAANSVNSSGGLVTSPVANANLANSSITINGSSVSLGGSVTVTAAAASMAVGTTTVGSGTTGRVLFDNAGVLGEYSISGSGSVAMTAGPTFTGTTTVATLAATTINGFTLAGTLAGGGNNINNVNIGASSPGTGAFSTLSASGHVTFEGVTSTGATGTAKIVFSDSPAFTTAITPAVSGASTLGTASLPWGNAFHSSGSKIDFGNGNVTLTHASGALTFAGVNNGTVFTSSAAGAITTNVQVAAANTSSGETHTSRFSTQDDNAGTIRTLFFAAGPKNAGSSNQGDFEVLTEDGGTFIVKATSTVANGGADWSVYDRSGNVKAKLSGYGRSTFSLGLNSSVAIGLASFTVATLPAGTAGDIVWCSNCRVFNGAGVQEGAGVGTGGAVQYNGTAWKIAGTNITAVA